jgi:acyl-coenzyme A synthetase/AMP-(fatty) acid ligase
MVPKIVEFRGALPKSENGKISRSRVLAEAQ